MRNPIARPFPRASSRLRPYAPLPFTPAPEPYDVPPRAAMVRPYVLHLERQRRQWRDDRSRLGVAVLLDLSRSAAVLG